MVVSKPGYPSSAIEGTSGSTSRRRDFATASARSFPERMCGSEVPMKSNIIVSRSAKISFKASCAPLYGTWTMSTPSAFFRIEAEVRSRPVSERPVAHRAGTGLGHDDQIFERLQWRGTIHDQHQGHGGDQGDRLKILLRIERHLRVREGVDDHRPGGGEEEVVAVRRRMRACGRSDQAAPARTILHDHRLPQPHRELRTDHARNDVAHRAGRRDRDEAYRSRRVGLRACSCGESDGRYKHADRSLHPPSARATVVS